jgi:hypothetical protein
MNDTVIFLVLAGLALVFKWLTRQASGEAEARPPSPNKQSRQSPPPRPPADSDAERVRRFLEALGAPPGTQPPPPVQPRRVITPTPRTRPAVAKRTWAQPLPPLVTTPEDLPPRPGPVVFEAAPPPPPVAAAPPPLPVVETSVRPAVSPLRKAAPARLMPLPSLGAILRSARTARQAIMLREVLGPPRGLQALDDLRSF